VDDHEAARTCREPSRKLDAVERRWSSVCNFPGRRCVGDVGAGGGCPSTQCWNAESAPKEVGYWPSRQLDRSRGRPSPRVLPGFLDGRREREPDTPIHSRPHWASPPTRRWTEVEAAPDTGTSDPSPRKPPRGTVEARASSTQEHRKPVDFLADCAPVMTPSVAGVLARIVRTLRDHQKREAA